MTTTEVAPHPKKSDGIKRIRTLTLVYSGGHVAAKGLWRLDRKPYLIGREPGDDPRSIVLEGDTKASRVHAEVRWEKSSDAHRLLDRGSKNGVFVGGRKVESAALQNGSVIRVGGSLLVYAEVDVPEGLPMSPPVHGVALRRALAEASADLAAPTELPILITGPTGAGKELLARRIHEKSGRKGALTAVNCATFSRELIGSELFGHAAGAFSGATHARSGLFVSAQRGTLFLDEIAELPLDQQPALLRALQEKKVRPVGADAELDVDVRVVAATHQHLEKNAEYGEFRTDLLARLAGFVIELPPLAERKEEVLALFARFLAGENAKEHPVSIEAAEALLCHGWPQNVRELRHAAERARLYVDRSQQLSLGALPMAIQNPPKPIPGAPQAPRIDDEPTKDELESMLAKFGGNVAEISRITGKHRQQVYRWLVKHGLSASSYRNDKDEPE